MTKHLPRVLLPLYLPGVVVRAFRFPANMFVIFFYRSVFYLFIQIHNLFLYYYYFLSPFFTGVVFLDVFDAGGLPPEGVVEADLGVGALVVVVFGVAGFDIAVEVLEVLTD